MKSLNELLHIVSGDKCKWETIQNLIKQHPGCSLFAFFTSAELNFYGESEMRNSPPHPKQWSDVLASWKDNLSEDIETLAPDIQETRAKVLAK